MTSTTAPEATVTVESALQRYYPDVQNALRSIAVDVDSQRFQPGFSLPELDERMSRFLEPSTVRVAELGSHGGTRLRLLDLMGNPATRTTKTMASLIMVARAVHHIQRTGERILIVTPTSANKGTALRDAVARAISCGLVSSDDLQIITLSPLASRDKLWQSGLDTDARLAVRNPVAVYPGAEGAGVKKIAEQFAVEYHEEMETRGLKIWYSLAIDNYRVADAVRAFVEIDHFAPTPDSDRVHVHAVSSAYGLLGRVSQVPSESSEPDVDHADGGGGFVPHGEFVVSGGQGAVLFEQVDAALHGVTLPVCLRVESGWPTPG